MISFDDENICGQMLTDSETWTSFQVYNENPEYYRKGDKVHEEVDVIRRTVVQEYENSKTDNDKASGNKKLL